jgi:hypothetical protein
MTLLARMVFNMSGISFRLLARRSKRERPIQVTDRNEPVNNVFRNVFDVR